MSAAGLEHAFREEWGAVVATLARRLGDLQAAEDAAAEAFAAAARVWRKDGVPPNPGGWLMVTAWRKALDARRRTSPVAVDPHVLSQVAPEAEEAAVDEQVVEPLMLGDDRLGLIFACCHPALALETRVALTLRFVAGLTTKQIAAAFLIPEPTLGQRLVRAKRKIKDAGIRFEVPARPAERLRSVRTVVYLVFNEGFATSGGDELIGKELCEEAIWLGRLLHRLLPADAETAGLLALMLLHHARAAAREAQGRPVPLEEQDRSRWDRALIAEGTRVLDEALDRHEPGSYQLQAAIAALHAQAPRFTDTDWPQITLLYGALARLDPSPVIEVNRAVAVGMADGPLAGLAVLEPVLASGALEGYSPLHAAHAALLEKAGYSERARGAWARAAETSANAALREELLRRHNTGNFPERDVESGERSP